MNEQERKRIACAASKRWQAENPEKVKALRLRRRKENAALVDAWTKANRQKTREYQRRWREKNKEKNKIRLRAWQLANPGKCCATTMRRKANLLQATPAWSETIEIENLYKARPLDCHVDHVVPLISPIVCGLHVLANLQYLPITENLRKGNRWAT